VLRELRAAGFGVIDELSLLFGPGFTVLTGETGTGKSLIVGALGLLLGAKADTDIVREGWEEAEVEGRFDVDAKVAALLTDAGFPVEEDLVIARRVRRGGSRAYVNGRIANTALLMTLGGQLAELVGQHSARSLVDPAVQRAALDRYGAGETRAALLATNEAFDRWRGLCQAREKLGDRPEARAREAEILRFEIEEIERAVPVPGEDETLLQEVHRLGESDSLREIVTEAFGCAQDARDAAGRCISLVERTAGAGLDRAGEAMTGAIAYLEDLHEELRDFLEVCHADPVRLAVAQERLHLLRELQRKYGPGIEDVLLHASKARERLAELEGAEVRLAGIEEKILTARGDLDAAVVALRVVRRTVAPRLGERVSRRLGELAMQSPAFRVGVKEAGRVERDGGDEVGFLFSGGQGVPLRPVGRVASGGELSRVLLAVSAELADLEAPPTIVFDEIDMGTGGGAALSIGRCLRELAQCRQVIAVTHLAQVACFADYHVALASLPDGVLRIAHVTGAAREIELSRMLSGSPGSIKARRHAAELLDLAIAPRSP